ncbi:PKD domain-containing protein [Mucilaginibacter calamicampi]|uniref:PKD domain-containing protein n=1 Tax=Mucilaginibacter calamicampi TaxID=1302352 RepID=A0ABW2YQC6_9SPHI
MINARTLYCAALVLLLFFWRADAFAQGTSNKGTEFWTLYMDHIKPPTATNGPSSMILYITSDLSTSGTVEIADGSFNAITFSVTANAVTMVNIPTSAFVGSQGKFSKGIHIKSLKPVAVYAHIYASSVSGATLLLPVSAMGKDYMSINYKQLSNSNTPNQPNNNDGPSYSTFAVIATEDNTAVEITPSEQLLNGAAKGVTFTVNLQKGELYQALADNDLTGTKIKSVSTAAGTCKKIAVFSGSTKIGIGCPPAANSPAGYTSLTSDNLFQQIYATSTWGKNYITAPLKSRPYDIYRVILSDPTTQVTVNGAAIAANQFVNGLYYEFQSTTTNIISANKPVQVVQYSASQGEGPNCTKVNADVGDPEMIYLSPIEQGLSKVTLYSSGYFDILNSYINVVLPTSAVSSFTVDGNPYSGFTPVAGKPEYSYAQITVSSGPANSRPGSVTSGTHTLKADETFTAIAYGFGQRESYGYAAGTNQLDLNTHLVFEDPADNTKSLVTACSGQSYKLQLTLPYATTRISWDIGDGTAPLVQPNPVPKSTTLVAGVTLYNYEYPGTVTYPPGNHTATATVFNPVIDECGSDQEVQFYFTVNSQPVSTIQVAASSCLGDVVQFKDASVIADGGAAQKWLWDFGDGTTFSTEQSPTHLYAAAGDYKVTLTVTDANGCSTISPETTVHIKKLPVASFNATASDCVNSNVLLTNNSTAPEGNIVKWTWNFGDGTPAEDKTTAATFSHVFTAVGTYTVKLIVTTDMGCISAVFQKDITIHPVPVVDFILPDACIDDVAKFTDLSTIDDHTESEFTYAWNFGDVNATAANNISNQKNAQHKYSAPGNYTVLLTVTSKYGCKSTKQMQFKVNGANPIAKFSVQNANNCSGSEVSFKDESIVPGGFASNIVKLVWFFDYDNHPDLSQTFTAADMHSDKIYTHKYALFNTPATKIYHVKLIAYSGESQSCTAVYDNSDVIVNANPIITLLYNNVAITTDISPLCQDNGVVEIKENKGIYAGTGVFSGTGITADGSFNPAVSGAGTFTISYTFTASATGCTYTTSFKITVNPVPVIQDDEQYVMLEGQKILLKPTVKISSGTLKYSWLPAATLDQADIEKPYANPVESTTYTLTVTSDKGCPAVKNIYVKVLKAPLIPNAFTPNSDGINDLWDIKYLNMYPNVTVEIFSRNGEKVYFSKGYASPWDGTSRGAMLPVGTYYYIINPGSGRKTATGYVSIIK